MFEISAHLIDNQEKVIVRKRKKEESWRYKHEEKETKSEEDR